MPYLLEQLFLPRDPVTILAIFNTYKVDPKLYTVIFGESILNDAIAIVLFETAQRYKEGGNAGTLGLLSLFEGIGIFLAVFFGSLIIGIVIGIATALGLKYTYVRRFPKIESCLIVLIAYASYFFSNGLHMSGIVTLLFCGITLKHYAYYNMSRRTQLTTKYLFQVLAQLSENFIFIYLGLSLFTEKNLQFKPLFIIVTVIDIAQRKRGQEVADELTIQLSSNVILGRIAWSCRCRIGSWNDWRELMGFESHCPVVVVLTVIIFGGTTARMLEILGIRTGVVEEIDSDDEFDIEAISGGNYYKHSGSGNCRGAERGSYASGNASPNVRPLSISRKGSNANGRKENESEQDLLGRTGSTSDEGFDSDSSDLPPPANRPPKRRSSPQNNGDMGTPYPTSGSTSRPEAPHITASGAISQLLHGTAEDHAAWFKQLDEGFIKPKLLLDGGKGPHGGSSGS
ncbi:hypothetical protein DID88_000700 [Monilinia fructigena]|uniref:Cation/H+ exchanger transmembrane domain-containing protein n=1 Tax=Monilinia fructigena TaxID=38457 RepID=A0A395IJK8_9HELO|nr:hypothetical protein DID88_000700 [Monilinia fructigena]